MNSQGKCYKGYPENPSMLARCENSACFSLTKASEAKCLRFGLSLQFGLRCECRQCQVPSDDITWVERCEPCDTPLCFCIALMEIIIITLYSLVPWLVVCFAQEKKSTKTNFVWVRRPPGGVGVEQFAPSLESSGPSLPSKSKEKKLHPRDALGISAGCPRPLGCSKSLCRKGLCSCFGSDLSGEKEPINMNHLGGDLSGNERGQNYC